MRILFITWEFPPLISGGLGTACYGMAQALLRTGLALDLVLPTLEEAYFPLREPEDADRLPVALLEPDRYLERRLTETTESGERMEALGLSPYPETYLTPGFSFGRFWSSVPWSRTVSREVVLQTIQASLAGPGDLFSKVQELTAKSIRLYRKLDFDLIHVHDWLTFPAGVVLKKLTGKPLVAHVHATEFDRAGGAGNERIHRIEHAGLSQADLIITVSRYTSEMIVDRYQISSERLRVVHNAHTFDSGPTESRRIFKGPLILFLGRITIQKGPDYFLEVARLVLKKHPEARFVMAGAGDMMTRLLHRSAVQRMGPRFLFTDFLNRRQVDQILSAADIFIMPSVSEPFGIVPLEAMAHGTAAIISKQSGVAEVLVNALKIDFWDLDQMADAVNELIENPGRRLALAQAGREEVLAIKWDEAAQSIRQIYRELGG